MSDNCAISAYYIKLFGDHDHVVITLPRSGSDRRYFRVKGKNGNMIGTFNTNIEENDAFLGFTDHFRNKKLPVPEIYGVVPDRKVYFQQDLGDINLYTWLHNGRDIEHFSSETKQLYIKILDFLIRFQTEGIRGLDLDLCYPHRSFDRQSMMWDLNYFKYMLLKLLAVPFNEKHLEKDFDALADYLLDAGQDYFLYRDFQTANVMILNEEPWFIDYQGGRKGAAQYDVASLLYDAKIPMSERDRKELFSIYLEHFCSATGADSDSFTGYYTGFSMIRIMQALGAFGFRGLYEKKPTFKESIVPAVELLSAIAAEARAHVKLPELFSTINAIQETPLFMELTEKHQSQ